jgi:hypothetical protein
MLIFISLFLRKSREGQPNGLTHQHKVLLDFSADIAEASRERLTSACDYGIAALTRTCLNQKVFDS